MKVVLDNNVLVGAVITPQGIPGSIFQAWRRTEFQLVVSAPLLSELGRVLAYPRIRKRTRWAYPEEDAFIELLREDSLEVVPEHEIAVSRDPTDNRVLEAAETGAVDYIVSGDQDLLVLKKFHDIIIISPTAFLAILTEQD